MDGFGSRRARSNPTAFIDGSWAGFAAGRSIDYRRWSMDSQRIDGRHAAFLIAAAGCWGVATVISKRAIAEIPPLPLLTIQLTASAIVLFSVVRMRGGVDWTPRLKRLATLGVLNPGISYALGLAGLTMITASLSVVLWATEPLVILLLAAWLLREEVTGAMMLALLAAMAGVGLVVLDAGNSGSLLGIALSLAGVVACAVYTIAVRKWMIEEETLEAVYAQQLYALLFSIGVLAVDLVVPGGAVLGSWSAEAWVSAVASGILYYAVAFWFYVGGLRHVPAAVAGTFLTLIPIFGIAGGYLFLGERLSGRQGLGSLLIVLSVGALVQRHSRRLLTAQRSSIIVDSR